MNEPYLHCYSALGLKPGSDWREIRDAYRALIKTWHPDRFQQDGKNRKVAEEATMEITRAYKVLADYYREHGTTPPYPAASPAPSASASAHRNRATNPVDVPASDAHVDHPVPKPVESARWKTFFVLSAIALLLYLWLPEQGSHDRSERASPEHATPDANPPATGGTVATRPADRLFTVGTKLGEVYAIQGVPTKTAQDVWHYGKSRVYFVDGSVSRWDSHPENPLHASFDAPAVARQVYIKRGSTKDEVRALQGTPWRQTEREWTYGSSRIFFSGNVVTGWEESSVNPLKIQR